MNKQKSVWFKQKLGVDGLAHRSAGCRQLIEFMHSNTRNVSLSKPSTLLSSNILHSWAGGQDSDLKHTC